MSDIRYTKVDETWALRSEAPLTPNTTVTVTKANGERKTEVAGQLLRQITGRYPAFIYAIARNAAQAPRQTAHVGDLSGLMALFDIAKQHLKYPKILMLVDGLGLRISVAGPAAKVPGSLNVTSATNNGEEGREWYGRVLRNGTYEPTRAANGRTDKIAQALRELASDPARAAYRYSKATARPVGDQLIGNCCFCGQTLTDNRSLAVGYGPICADHFGLPWGDVKSIPLASDVRPQLDPNVDTSSVPF